MSEQDIDNAETGSEQELERAREPDGTYRADDPTTPDVNEAWVQTGGDQGSEDPAADTQASPDPDEGNDESEGEEEAPEPTPEGMALVTITDSPDSNGVTLIINGKEFSLPLNKPITVPSWIIPALEDAGGVTFTQE